MAKKYLQIQIPTPCSEDFSKMTPAEKGNFCSNCEKVVIDFSKMSDQEIADFYKNSKGKLCGRFHPSQLNRNIRLTPPKVNSIFGKAAGLILTGVLSAASTNVAAQDLGVNPSISIVDSESENEGKEEEKKEPIKERIIKIIVSGNMFPKENKSYLKGASVTHLGTKATSLTDSLGVAEIRIPDFCFKEKDLTFSIDYFFYKTKELVIDPKTIKDSTYQVELEYDLEFLVVGWTLTIESDFPTFHPHAPTKTNTEAVRDFDFEVEESNVEEVKLAEPQKNDDPNSKEKDSIILPPLGVAIKKVYPNPFIDRINIEVSTGRKGLIQINLIDISGRTVFQKVEQAEIGTQQFQIEVGNLSLSGSMYILQVQDERGNTQTQQLMRFTNQGFTMR